MIPPNTPPVIIIYFGLFNLHYSFCINSHNGRSSCWLCLPHVVVLIVVEVEGLCPPCLLADAGDVLLHLGSDEAHAVAVFVVLATGIAADEAALDANLQLPRHAVVEVYHSLGVRGGDVLTVLRTLVGTDLRQQRIDTAYLDDGGVSLLPYQPAQTALVQRTVLDVAQQVVGCLLAEYFFLAHHVFSVSILQRYTFLCDSPNFPKSIFTRMTADWYLSYLFVYVTLIRNRSKNYKFNFYLHFNVTTSPSS